MRINPKVCRRCFHKRLCVTFNKGTAEGNGKLEDKPEGMIAFMMGVFDSQLGKGFVGSCPCFIVRVKVEAGVPANCSYRLEHFISE